MKRGKFRRMLKVEASVVTDHRNVGSPEAVGSEWVEVEVPADRPASLNNLVSSGALTWDGSKLGWADYDTKRAAYKAKRRARRDLDRAADMDARRAFFAANGKLNAATRATAERDRLMALAGDKDG